MWRLASFSTSWILAVFAFTPSALALTPSALALTPLVFSAIADLLASIAFAFVAVFASTASIAGWKSFELTV